MERTGRILACLGLLLVFTVSAEAIQCYECNSGETYNGTACSTLPPDAKPTECDMYTGMNYTRCRKTVQIVGSETRVIRSCATAGTAKDETPRCADHIGTSDIRVKYCECYKDGCNGSSGFVASVLLVAATALSNQLFS